MQREDTLPWYRQFWPWFVIAIPASAVVAGLATVWIAMQTGDSLVIAPAGAPPTATGVIADIAVDAGTGAVTVVLNDPETAQPERLSLSLRHPTLARKDIEVELFAALPNAAGLPTWAGHFLGAPEGRYYVVLTDNDRWHLSGEWRGEATLRLGSAAASVDEP